MENYYLSPKGIHSILNDKGVNFLFHANTLQTSLTFINERALLSRAYVERNNLTQTPQKSDNEDRKFDVWDDVFLDAVDLHQIYSRPNNYGPILFILKLDLLLSQNIQFVMVTKKNPWYWKDHDTFDDKYYSNLDDLKADYLTGKRLDSQIMFTFKSPEKSVKLNKFLVGIGIDNPSIESQNNPQITIGEKVLKEIRESLDQNGLKHIKIRLRHSNSYSCTCQIKYRYMQKFQIIEFKKRFGEK